jgi:hypothetical protein
MDITLADGQVIMPNYKLGIVSIDMKSKYNWPIQQEPGKPARKL